MARPQLAVSTSGKSAASKWDLSSTGPRALQDST